jgi:beta-lactamase class D
MRSTGLVLASVLLLVSGCMRSVKTPPEGGSTSAAVTRKACFLLHEVGVGEVRRAPSEGCSTRVTPASTFKIPHALAALDSGVLAGPEVRFPYDGSPQSFPTWQRDHTLASAMRYSVVWYFERIATMLGPEREAAYLHTLSYGNQESSGGPHPFWIGGALRISPDEQESFLVRLYGDALPVGREAQRVVRELLVQPPGLIVNAAGEHPFDAPWPEGTVLSAKTGSSGHPDGQEVRWVVGHVKRRERSWLFVTCVTGGEGLEPSAAVDLAAGALRQERVL